MNRDVTISKDADELAARAAELIIAAAREAFGRCGRFTLVAAGGTTPEKTYRLLGAPGALERIDWGKTYLFFGDERVVPPDDPRSNFRMVEASLLSHVPLPSSHVLACPTDRPNAAECARAYGEQLAAFFRLSAEAGPPVFDLVLLGMGEDGHTASLFPGSPALQVEDAWVTWSPPGALPPPVDRITLTYPVINAARQVMFLVAGESKASALRDVLEGGASREQRPAAGVQPRQGRVTWVVDEAAARLLQAR